MKYCIICGQQGDLGGTCDSCANCWEVCHRLDQFLKDGKESAEEMIYSALARHYERRNRDRIIK